MADRPGGQKRKQAPPPQKPNEAKRQREPSPEQQQPIQPRRYYQAQRPEPQLQPQPPAHAQTQHRPPTPSTFFYLTPPPSLLTAQQLSSLSALLYEIQHSELISPAAYTRLDPVQIYGPSRPAYLANLKAGAQEIRMNISNGSFHKTAEIWRVLEKVEAVIAAFQ